MCFRGRAFADDDLCLRSEREVRVSESFVRLLLRSMWRWCLVLDTCGEPGGRGLTVI